MRKVRNYEGVNRDHGFVLITSLMFLIVLTIYVVSSARFATLSERIAGNTRSRTIAFYGAEAGLRRGFLVLKTASGSPTADDGSSSLDNNKITTIPASYSAHALVATTSKFTCTLNAATGACKLAAETAGPTITAGGSLSVTQPTYIISELTPGTGDTGKKYFVITSIGYGLTSTSKVVLQELVVES